jgi:hypothetical protein
MLWAPQEPTAAQREALIRLSRTARALATPSSRPVWAALSEWVVIGVAVGLTFIRAHPAVWIGAAFLIGCRQHCAVGRSSRPPLATGRATSPITGC